MIPYGATEPTVCDVPDCGLIRCSGGCDERITCAGPEPLPRCIDHPTCADCDGPVTCTECCLILAERAQDRADDLAYDVAREVDDPSAYDLPMTGATYLRAGERRNIA